MVGYSPWGRKESDTTERLHSLTYLLTYLLTLVKFFLSSRLFLVTYIPGKHVKFMKSTSSKYVVCCFLEAEMQIFKSLSEEQEGSLRENGYTHLYC